MRAFLGVPLPDPLCAKLARVAQGIEGLRAQKAGTIHLTIRFLGDIREPDRIAAAVEPVVTAHEPFDLHLMGLGAFPDHRRAHVVWVRLAAGALEAGSLAAGVENALLPLGFDRERRAYKAHITLGRFRSPKRLHREILDPNRNFGTARAGQLVLYQSTLTPQGAVHRHLRVMSLGSGM
ncbi:MAG: RNA 2',3'-cyclic phosphodiesterase [Planctomycetota bacterium]|jgi:2'-5' RNA ligase